MSAIIMAAQGNVNSNPRISTIPIVVPGNIWIMKTMDQVSATQLFVRVVETSSFSKAA